MTEKLEFDYRVIELELTCKFDYMENEIFEEFYLKLKHLCDDYDVHMKGITRRQDILNYEKGRG